LWAGAGGMGNKDGREGRGRSERGRGRGAKGTFSLHFEP